MAEINLTQAEADALLAMEKHRLDDASSDFPSHGGDAERFWEIWRMNGVKK